MINKGDIQDLVIQWTLNGKPIMNGKNGVSVIRISKKLSTLSLDSINDQHRGIIKCIATNIAGTTEYSTELQVNGTSYFINILQVFGLL